MKWRKLAGKGFQQVCQKQCCVWATCYIAWPTSPVSERIHLFSWLAGVQTIAKGMREHKSLAKSRDNASNKYDKLLKAATKRSRTYGCAKWNVVQWRKHTHQKSDKHNLSSDHVWSFVHLNIVLFLTALLQSTEKNLFQQRVFRRPERRSTSGASIGTQRKNIQGCLLTRKQTTSPLTQICFSFRFSPRNTTSLRAKPSSCTRLGAYLLAWLTHACKCVLASSGFRPASPPHSSWCDVTIQGETPAKAN